MSGSYLLWFQLRGGNRGGVHHGLGALRGLDDAVPLGWQAHKVSHLGIKGGVDPVLKVPGRGDLQLLLLLLFAKHLLARKR